MPYKDPEVRRAKSKERAARWHKANREKISARKKLYHEANKEKVGARHRLNHAKYYPANRERILANGRARRSKEPLAGRPKPDFCEVCGRPPTKKGLHFDHSHQSGHFRGWICSNCNSALGHVRDDVNVLLKLIAYLERNHTNTAPQLALAGI